MAQWYVAIGSETTGPFSTEQVLEDIKKNRIPVDATVCAAGDTRFIKITDEPELSKAFAPATPAAVCSTTKCCPMPRIAAVTTLLLGAAFWATAAVAAGRCCGTESVSFVRIAFAGLVGLASLASIVGIVRRSPRAHCGASALHLAGLIGAVSVAALGKTCCPLLAGVGVAHVVGLLSTRAARKQACKTV